MSARHCEKSGCSWIGEPALKSQCPNVKLGEWKIRPRQPGSFSMTDIDCVSRIGILIPLDPLSPLFCTRALFAGALGPRVTQLRSGRVYAPTDEFGLPAKCPPKYVSGTRDRRKTR